MPRTNLPRTTLTANDHTAALAGLTIDATLVTNGCVINAADFERTVLLVENTGGDTKSVTVKAGNSTASYTATRGDLAAPVPGTGGQVFVGPFSSARFQQHGGALHVDFETGFTGTVTALQVPQHT
ncbi:hypothetical protein [Streptomyces drozdowiczii]|uniref:hypothetical protein n=1 Tax=Streptomyces drozdowiczii TaxID=202862 RepID=UPI00403D4F41